MLQRVSISHLPITLMPTEKHIVAMGGHTVAPGVTPALYEYALSLTGLKRPRVCDLPTATGDSPTGLIKYFYDRIPADRAERSHLNLFERTVRDLRRFLLSQHVILVGGGNTANMLAVWRTHGVDHILREAWESGIVLCGASAGSLCWFECGLTDSFDLSLPQPMHDGLGLIPGSHCPHYTNEKRKTLYRDAIAQGFPGGYAIDDDAAIRFAGTEIAEVVTSRDGATAYRVELSGERVVEAPLEARMIGRPTS